jgi:hypothetical protein
MGRRKKKLDNGNNKALSVYRARYRITAENRQGESEEPEPEPEQRQQRAWAPPSNQGA